MLVYQRVKTYFPLGLTILRVPELQSIDEDVGIMKMRPSFKRMVFVCGLLKDADRSADHDVMATTTYSWNIAYVKTMHVDPVDAYVKIYGLECQSTSQRFQNVSTYNHSLNKHQYPSAQTLLVNIFTHQSWLVVSTPLENISQLG